MNASTVVVSISLAALCAGAWASPAAASAASGAQVIRAAGDQHAARVACPADAASAPAPRRATSKVRHVPSEDDPCASSEGVGPLPQR